MDPFQQSLQEYIKSGEYFVDARKWYNYKYIYPLSQRTYLLTITSIILVVALELGTNIFALFPLEVQVRYSVLSQNALQSSATIINAEQIYNDPLASITDIIIRNYTTMRENYDYDRLKDQFVFIKNNSSRIVFRKFYNFMNIDNEQSPIMKFQKYIRRTINIISATYTNENDAKIKFESLARSGGGEIFENAIWEATINYEIDEINKNLPPDSRFNFIVTNYQLKLIEDKMKK